MQSFTGGFKTKAYLVFLGYLLPNDDKEMQRLDLVDEMITCALGGLHLAPVGPHPHRVLDIGTGSGAVSFYPPTFGDHGGLLTGLIMVSGLSSSV